MGNNMRSMSLSLMLFCLITSISQAEGKHYAVLVGVEKYQASQFPPLKYAVEDMSELGQFLEAGGYSVTLLTDDSGKADKSLLPTRTNIEQHVQQVLKSCQKDDVVLLAFSGHGLKINRKKDAYFCPSDAVPDVKKTGTFVSVNKLYRLLNQCSAGTKVVFFDACRNKLGRGMSGLHASAASRAPRGVVAFFSCSAGQIGSEHDQLQHSLFFHSVLEGLKGEAVDSSGKITLAALSKYVQKKVPAQVRELFPRQKSKQIPNVQGDLTASVSVLAKVDSSFNASSAPKKMTKPKKTLSGPAEESITNSIGIKLLLIPEGEFVMGSSKSAMELGRMFRLRTNYFEHEHPQHQVKISKPFYIGETEVTQKQWQAVMKATPWKGRKYVKRGDDYPASNVSWEAAQLFIEKLNEKEGVDSYRLPTEAEWEYACRAGTATMYSFGDNISDLKDYAWFKENASDEGEKYPHQVKQKQANAFGLFDMHGNLYEWCQDRYGRQYYKNSPNADPSGPSDGEGCVVRGGSWSYKAYDIRSAGRTPEEPDNDRSSDIGFRIVKTITP